MADALLSAGAVTLGALIGGPARFFISGFVARRVGETFPWGTLAVNAIGAFLIGLAGAFARAHALSAQTPLVLFLVTGILGSFTTVSSLALQTRALARDGEPRRALANIALSLALGLAAAAGGFSTYAILAGRG